RYRESLRDNAELIRKSQELAQIRTDVSVQLDLDVLESRPPDRAAAYELFRELEFTALTNEFADAAVATVRPRSERKYAIIRNKAELDALLPQLWQAEHLGVAIANESPAGAGQQQSGRNERGATGISFAQASDTSTFIDLENFAEENDQALDSLRELLGNGLLERCVHDLKRATALLAPLEVELAGVGDDTLLAAYVLDPTRSKYELNDLAREAAQVEGGGPPFAGWSETAWQTAEAADLT